MHSDYLIRTAVLAFGLLLSGPVASRADTAPPAGVPHFVRVDEGVYRGGQPSKKGFQELARLGVKTIIDLRHSARGEREMVEAAGMHYVQIPMSGFEAPTDAAIGQALTVMNGAGTPVFIHCRKGKDRTGTVVACYRIWKQKWTNSAALQEAKSLGMSWLQKQRRRYILQYDGLSN